MNGGGKIAGPALILVGLLMLLGQMGMPVFGVLWPLILLAIGVGMILRYRQGGENSGLVFSGVLLVLFTALLLGARANVLHLGHHWPAFLAAIGVSFLAMAQVDPKRRDAMVPGWICLGIAAVLYFFSLGLFAKLVGFLVRVVGTLLKVVIPLGLMGFGGWLLFHDRQEQNAGLGADFPEKVSPEPPAPSEEAMGEAVEAVVDDSTDLAEVPVEVIDEAEDAEFETLPEGEPVEEMDDAADEDEPRREN